MSSKTTPAGPFKTGTYCRVVSGFRATVRPDGERRDVPAGTQVEVLAAEGLGFVVRDHAGRRFWAAADDLERADAEPWDGVRLAD